MEEAPENSKKWSHSACVNGMNEHIFHTDNKDRHICYSDILDQSWRTYGMQNDFLGTKYSLLSQFFLFIWHDQPLYVVKNMYVHIHTTDDIETVYELPLLPNNTVGETFLCKSGVV
jgi:hypothetical protein